MNKLTWFISMFFLVLGLYIGIHFDELMVMEFGTVEMNNSGMSGTSMDEQGMVHSGNFQVVVNLDPQNPRVGKNKLIVRVGDKDGSAVAGATVRAVLQLQDNGAMSNDMTMTGDMEMSKDNVTSMQTPGMQKDTTMERSAEDMKRMSEKSSDDAMQTDMQNSQSSMLMDSSMDTSADKRKIKGDAPMNDSPSDMETAMEASKAMDSSSMIMNGGMKSSPGIVVIDMNEIGPGKYVGTFELSRDGKWALAVDVEKGALGHADLLFDMPTGSGEGLQLATTTPGDIAYYTCSMHTSVRAVKPGQCPICSMDLTPVTREEVQTGTITVDSRRRQLIGLVTDVARQRELVSTIRAVGEVMYDETRLVDINLRFDAWVGELKADYVGKEVNQGEMLFSVYGPDLLAAQQEYLEVLKRRRAQSSGLVSASRKRLSLWGMTSDQISQLEKRGEPLDYVPVMAPRDGTVVEKTVVTGTANKAGTMLMRIADLTRVWVEADVYESELDLVKPGMQAEVTLPYMPGRTYSAIVDYIYPYLMNKTRTGRIRLVLDNPQGTLKPDMYAEVRLKADLGRRLAVPEQAVLFAGDTRVVFVDQGAGKLKPRTVKTGVRNEDYIEIIEGLNPGDKVVTSGNFLIAAESRLKSGMQHW